MTIFLYTIARHVWQSNVMTLPNCTLGVYCTLGVCLVTFMHHTYTQYNSIHHTLAYAIHDSVSSVAVMTPSLNSD